MHSPMESIYSNSSSSKSSSSKAVKARIRKGGVSPLMIKYLNSSSNSSSSSSVDPFPPSPYSSNNSGSPLSAVEGEDVLVMDDILVSSSSNNSGCYKKEICRSWDDFSKCRYGAKCQFAHGKEEVRPSASRFPVPKNKSEICKSLVTRSCLYGSKPQHTVKTPKTECMTPTAFKLEQPSKTPTIETKAAAVRTGGRTSITSVDWSPQDDGIEVVLPSQPDNTAPSRQDVDAYIDHVLYQPSARRRLPLFEEICPE